MKIRFLSLLALAVLLLSSFTSLADVVNLSEGGTANCYIVSQSGCYKFRAVKGCRKWLVGQVASASVLWESFGTNVTPQVGELIKEASYDNGYITFQTADTFQEGNAVIAAKDASGKILWSWHIWFTDQPEEQVYYNNAGSLMDRNLGATSATPGDPCALGLLYQWGRKDPFLGGTSILVDFRNPGFSPYPYYDQTVIAKSTLAWPSVVTADSSRGTIEYTIANPTTLIVCYIGDSDWQYNAASDVGDKNRWTTSKKAKSIYDPCPVGWRVPDGGSKGVWAKALGSVSADVKFDQENRGVNFSGQFGSAPVIWYPAAGRREYRDGDLYPAGYEGRCWAASAGRFSADGLTFGINRRCVDPDGGGFCASAFSVRCIKEIN